MILNGKSKLRLRVAGKNLLRTYPQLTGNACIVSEAVRNSGWFDTALLERLSSFSIDATKGLKNPDENLDEYGVVKIGTKVSHHSILAATLSTVPEASMAQEEKVLAAIFTHQPQIIATAEQIDDALVTNVDIKGFKKGKVVTIDLLIQRPLTIGDVLEDGHGHTLVVAGFGAKGCFDWDTDILVHADANILKSLPKEALRAVKFTKVTQRAEDKLAARSTGAYSVVTHQAISEHPNPGQKVRIDELAQLGYVQNAVEMATVKSSGIHVRGEAYKALLCQEPVPTFETATTYSAHRLATLMGGCGFSVKTEGSALHIARLTDAGVVKQSHGEVKKPETLDYRTLKPERDGLFCEAIFGNNRDMECSCGKLQGIRYKGITCAKCGVQVDSYLAPNNQFGHITLAIPVVHPWLKMQCAETLAQAGIGDVQRIIDIILYTSSILDDDDDARENDWGAVALEKACKEQGIDISRFLMHNLPVLPTNLRPMVQTDAKTFAISDLNDLYRRIINRNNRVAHLTKMGAPDVIVTNERKMVQEAVDTLMCNTAVEGPSGRLLRSIDTEIDNAARDFYERRVDYSAAAVCVPDLSLPQKTLGVPIAIAAEILKPIIVGAMVADGRTQNVKKAKRLLEDRTLEPYITEMLSVQVDRRMVLAVAHSSRYIPMRMRVCEGEVIRLNPSDASAFGISFGGEHLAIHLPLSKEAQQELEATLVPSEEDYTTSLASLTCENIVTCAMSDTPFLLGSLDKLVFRLS